MPKQFVDWLLWIAPTISGWVVGSFIGLLYGMGQFGISPVSSEADAGKAAAVFCLITVTIIALVAHSKIKSGLIFAILAYAGFMVTMPILLNDIHSVKIVVDAALYEYVAIGIAVGTAIPCFVVALAQRYYPRLNRIKNYL